MSWWKTVSDEVDLLSLPSSYPPIERSKMRWRPAGRREARGWRGGCALLRGVEQGGIVWRRKRKELFFKMRPKRKSLPTGTCKLLIETNGVSHLCSVVSQETKDCWVPDALPLCSHNSGTYAKRVRWPNFLVQWPGFALDSCVVQNFVDLIQKCSFVPVEIWVIDKHLSAWSVKNQ